ncbi:hypothetical protein Vafri_17272 [Volvox africanus]|uniref:Ferredoxin n=1 Tax=Volvox africanus TaxID=51714 RepID=A0A8J4BK33_9CHLO|nr:hypothetical protein Vafri_17272 [Volvox africanus]
METLSGVTSQVTAAAQKIAPAGSEDDASRRMRRCIDNCRDCEQICLTTITHCLSKGGHHARPDHILALMNCANICATAARFMITFSRLHIHICGACAAVCEACADDCEGVMGAEAEDKTMAECVDMCRACAKSCSEMATPMKSC